LPTATKPVHSNSMLRISAFIIITFLLNSCIKPYACECDHVQTKQKSHVLIYSTKSKRGEACRKNGQDSTVVCYIK
jgi:hypothetical protein